MTTASIPHRDFYVYALFRADGTTPFYIGKGRGNRINIHERDALRGTTHKDRIIQQLRSEGWLIIHKAKLIEGLTDAEAKKIEVDLIHLIGRWPAGPLANLTDGGDGVSNLSTESRARKSAANRASWANPDVRAKRGRGIAQAWTPERRAKNGKWLTKEIVGRALAATMAPDVRKKIRELARTPESRKKKSVAMKAIWQDPEKRAARCAASKKSQSSPAYRAKRSQIAKAIWSRRKGQNALPSAIDSDPPQLEPQQP